MTRIFKEIPIKSIVTRQQVRRQFDSTELGELAATIREQGVQQPIIVRMEGDKYILIVGERRVRASSLAGLMMIPAIIEDKALTAAEILELQLIENVQRIDLSVLDKARGIERLMKEPGAPVASVAKKLGMSNGSLSRLSSLLSLPPAIQQQIESGELSASAAYELSRVDDADQQSALAAQVVRGQLTRDALSGALKATKSPNSNAGQSTVSRVTAIMAGDRSVTVVAPCLTLECFIRILEELRNQCRAALKDKVTLATFTKILKDQANA
jgi:ParB family chromosome partitioning protein